MFFLYIEHYTKYLPVCYFCRSIVYLEIDNRLCAAQSSESCFPTAERAADYLGALSAVEMLRFPYPIKEAVGE